MGNPGISGIGGVIKVNTETVATFSNNIGTATNNEAEYLAVIEALKLLKDIKHEKALLMSDSQLVINQINGLYEVRKPHIHNLYAQVERLTKKLHYINFRWIPREQNGEADALASSAASMPMAHIKENSIEFWKRDPDHIPDLTDLPKTKTECHKQIVKLLDLGPNARFRDFRNLKTHGIDKYSRLKVNSLLKIIAQRYGSSTVEWLENTLGGFEDDYSRKVLKWCARGLEPDLALKKVSVEQEVASNFISKKR
jgi:ribonuclease HI